MHSFKTLTFQQILVPKQRNNYDCGVFVCRYASAVYSLLDQPVTFQEDNQLDPFSALMAPGGAFHFNPEDIGPFRRSFQKILLDLSYVYDSIMASKTREPEL